MLATAAVAAAPARAAEQQAYAAALTYATPAVAAGKGDTLRFTNLDAVAAHDVDSDQAGLFDSPLISAGESTLVSGVERLEPGTYAFHCSIHSWMKGALTVAGASTGGGPSPDQPGSPGGGGEPPNPADLLPKAPAEPLGPGDWPLYGHDLSNSRDGGTAGPSYNEVPTLGPVWSFRSRDGDYTGTPVVVEDMVLVGSRGGTVSALDAATGTVRWQRDLLDDETEKRDSQINASIAVAGEMVYVPLLTVGSPRVVALRLGDGGPVWSAVVDTQPRSDTYGSPTVWNGRVYIGTSGYFGEQISGVETSARGSVVALDARTGRRLWKTFTVPEGHDGGAVWSTPAIDTDSGRLYVGTGNAYHAPAGDMTDSMVALDAATGEVLDWFQATRGDVWNGAEDSLESPDADFGASPNLFEGPDGRKLVGQGQKTGVYWALDRGTMDPVWNVLTGPGSFMGGIIGSTAFDSGQIYGPNSQGGAVWAIGRDASPKWASSDGGPLHFAPVSVANGVVYSNDLSGFLTAREAKTGAALNRVPLGSGSWGGIAIAGGSVFAAIGSTGGNGYIAAYRPRERSGSGEARAADRAAPRLKLTGARRQRGVRRGSVVVGAVCNERCVMEASGRATVRRRRGALALRGAADFAVAAQKRRLVLKIPARARRTLRRGLARRRSVAVAVAVTARDGAGNTTTARRAIRVTR